KSDVFTEDFSSEAELFATADNVAHQMRSLKADYNISKKDVVFKLFCDLSRLDSLNKLKSDMDTLGNGLIEVFPESEAGKYVKGFIPLVVDGHLQLKMEAKGNIDIEAR